MATEAAGSHNVFVYGTLQSDDVVLIALNRVPQWTAAVLHDYHRFRIKDQIYPAILPVEKKKVTGRVLQGITDAELDALTQFETDLYERKDVEVVPIDGSANLQTYVFVWSNKDDPNLYGEWNFEEWEVKHKEEFIKFAKGIVEEMEKKTKTESGST